jgi:hypothetical protein
VKITFRIRPTCDLRRLRDRDSYLERLWRARVKRNPKSQPLNFGAVRERP